MQNGDDNWDRIWQQLSEGMAMNPGRDYRYQAIVKQIRSLNSMPLHIIDAGCGTGQLLEILSQEFPNANLSGFEISEEAINQTQDRVPKSAVFKIDTTSELPAVHEKVEQSQLIILSEVLEHLDNPKQTLQWLKSFVGLDGCLIVTVPAGPMSFFDRFIGHRTHFNKKTIEFVLVESGWSPIKVYKSGFPGINLIRIAAIVRGKRIIQDLQNASKFGFKRRFFFLACRTLLKISSRNSPFGWQLVVVAKINHEGKQGSGE